jgi:hypothetical protein
MYTHRKRTKKGKIPWFFGRSREFLTGYFKLMNEGGE